MFDRVLKLNDVKELSGLSRSSIYAAMSRGEFPSQVKLGPRAVGWLQADIDAWIAALPKKHVAKGVQS